MDNTEDYVITWEAPVIEKPEFRLYYDERGNVVSYTCEKLIGNYIVIDALTFAEARPDVKVIDGKVVRNQFGSVISRLYPDDLNGILCEKEDVSVISSHYDGQFWKLKTVNY